MSYSHALSCRTAGYSLAPLIEQKLQLLLLATKTAMSGGLGWIVPNGILVSLVGGCLLTRCGSCEHVTVQRPVMLPVICLACTCTTYGPLLLYVFSQ